MPGSGLSVDLRPEVHARRERTLIQQLEDLRTRIPRSSRRPGAPKRNRLNGMWVMVSPTSNTAAPNM